MPTSHNDFDVARKLFQNSVFVIPTFQRPYAWEKNQMDDLIHDIHYASTLKKPVHYLSPIHAIKIENPQQPEWIKYSEPVVSG